MLFQSCKKDDCPYSTPGSTPPSTTYQNIGNFKLIDSTKYWIDALDTSLLIFSNNSGGFISINLLNGYNYFYQSNTGQPISTSKCYPTFIQNQYGFEVYSKHYKINADLNTEIWIGRFKDKSQIDYCQYNSLDTSKQIADELNFFITVPNSAEGYSIKIFPKSKNEIYYDSLKIGSKIYTKVYYSFLDTIGWNVGYWNNGVNGIYYATNVGLLGFNIFGKGSWYKQ